MDWSTNCLVAPTAMCVVGALAVRFGLRGSLWVGAGIGLVLFYGIALPLLAGPEDTDYPAVSLNFYLNMGAFSVIAATLALLAVVRRREKKVHLTLAAITSMPLFYIVLYYTPFVLWGLAGIAFIPAVVFLAKALCIWVRERVEAGTFREYRGAFLSHLPSTTVEGLIAIYDRGPSLQLVAGRLNRPDSSANLAANTRSASSSTDQPTSRRCRTTRGPTGRRRPSPSMPSCPCRGAAQALSGWTCSSKPPMRSSASRPSATSRSSRNPTAGTPPSTSRSPSP